MKNEWMKLALESELAATIALENRMLRAAISRYYYAAYQGATAFFHHCRLTPPTVDLVQRQSWSHVDTLAMLSVHLKEFVPVSLGRHRIVAHVRELYVARVSADYTLQPVQDEAGVLLLRKKARHALRLFADIIGRDYK